MKFILAVLSAALVFCALPVSGYDECYLDDYSWTCDYTCCFSYAFCCNSFAAVYWYAWVIIVIFVLLCVCACAGGGYGYRRYYYVRRLQYPPATTAVVTSATTANSGYQTYSAPGAVPPSYNPSAGYQQAPPKY